MGRSAGIWRASVASRAMSAALSPAQGGEHGVGGEPCSITPPPQAEQQEQQQQQQQGEQQAHAQSDSGQHEGEDQQLQRRVHKWRAMMGPAGADWRAYAARKPLKVKRRVRKVSRRRAAFHAFKLQRKGTRCPGARRGRGAQG